MTAAAMQGVFFSPCLAVYSKNKKMPYVAIVKGFDLDQDQREIYEERAAILEFDAGFSRAEAERMALATADNGQAHATVEN